MTASSVRRASAPVGVIVLALLAGGSLVRADEPALRLRATPIGVAATEKPLSIELFRWSTDSERGPLLAALAPPASAPAPAVSAAPPAAARAGGRAAAVGPCGSDWPAGGGAVRASPAVR